jgi:hypothetical protein
MNRKIARVEKHGLYRVWFTQDGHEYPADMTEKQYKVLMLEQEFIRKGVYPKDLQTYKQAVVEERDEEYQYDED